MQWGANHALRLMWLGEAHLRTGDESAARRLGSPPINLLPPTLFDPTRDEEARHAS